jgi:hypothetical protein
MKIRHYMTPGEYGERQVRDYLLKTFPQYEVTLPCKDRGTDLYVIDGRSVARLQVKYSRDYTPNVAPQIQGGVRGIGWWKLPAQNLNASPADLWVLVLPSFAERRTDYIVIPPLEWGRRLRALQGGAKVFQSHLWVSHAGRCWEARGLHRQEQLQIVADTYTDEVRDMTGYLNAWPRLEGVLKAGRGA